MNSSKCSESPTITNSKTCFLTFEGETKMSNYSENDVKHDESQKMFYIELKNCDKKAFLQYEKDDKSFDLWHTEVPDECRGQGKLQSLR